MFLRGKGKALSPCCHLAHGPSSQLPTCGQPQIRAQGPLPRVRAGDRNPPARSPFTYQLFLFLVQLCSKQQFPLRSLKKCSIWGAANPTVVASNAHRRCPFKQPKQGAYVPEDPYLPARPSNLRSREGPRETHLVKENSAGKGYRVARWGPWKLLRAAGRAGLQAAGLPLRASIALSLWSQPARLGQNPRDGQ